MTSNIGSEIILQAKKIDAKVQQEIENLLHKHFRPEFLNRIDDIVYFNMLTPEIIKGIARNQIQELEGRLHEHGVALSISEDAIAWVADQGYIPEYGARPLKRAIKQYLVVPISQHLLKNPGTKKVHVTLENDALKLS